MSITFSNNPLPNPGHGRRSSAAESIPEWEVINEAIRTGKVFQWKTTTIEFMNKSIVDMNCKFPAQVFAYALRKKYKGIYHIDYRSVNQKTLHLEFSRVEAEETETRTSTLKVGTR